MGGGRLGTAAPSRPLLVTVPAGLGASAEAAPATAAPTTTTTAIPATAA